MLLPPKLGGWGSYFCASLDFVKSVHCKHLHAENDRAEAPGSTTITTEQIKISRIDSIFEQYYRAEHQVLLKIDTQGFEKDVLEGADCSLKHIIEIQIELSFVEHYRGEILFEGMLKFLNNKGFTLVNLQPLTHQLEAGNSLRQADGLFFRLS